MRTFVHQLAVLLLLPAAGLAADSWYHIDGISIETEEPIAITSRQGRVPNAEEGIVRLVPTAAARYPVELILVGWEGAATSGRGETVATDEIWMVELPIGPTPGRIVRSIVLRATRPGPAGIDDLIYVRKRLRIAIEAAAG